ncbi:type IIA DNA topoisomerase subunit B [Formicincola oecophyllae]|uniref:DNA topoisomerase (ATP-hydrolyzing) n=1 Tax=Formicincola oecophyllae TaxID=2558361 RepID=A0A4Y6UBD4_9PROT|nr:DNA topoisomerase IV subunit B [Formicincola oecophyllae]QDH13711.1 type IIA DNA topoisomerase subunit B [Formicincola oecophyllae]
MASTPATPPLDLLAQQSASSKTSTAGPSSSNLYDAQAIEVLDGLEAVRRRPGMYIGGTDATAFHHLAVEIIDNAMDEAVSGHASTIEVTLENATTLSVRDNGRGIPIGKHPKFPDKSALEVIFTILHAGGKFSGEAYGFSGGLHGVGSSVVNALSSFLEVEVAQQKRLHRQVFSQGHPQTPLEDVGGAPNRRGTLVRFTPDEEIFGRQHFSPQRLYTICHAKAALFRGVTIKWRCNPDLLPEDSSVPAEADIHFPNGLADALAGELQAREGAEILVPWDDRVDFPPAGRSKKSSGRMEWAMAFLNGGTANVVSWCNTIPTPQGGTHEAGLRAALTKSFRAWGEERKVRQAAAITADDILSFTAVRLSVFIPDPQFQGQTKEKLTNSGVSRQVEAALRDRLDQWFGADPTQADLLVEKAATLAEERLRRRDRQDISRKSATRRLTLPGKLTDCTATRHQNTEIFLVEGESAGGSARQARNRETQAVLPLRGKILNVASATSDKLIANQELRDLTEALGCGLGREFALEKLRYDRIVIMTDADVDGAHIASLLITFFYREMPDLIRNGHLYLACPPLYRLTHGKKTFYAMDDAERDKLRRTKFRKTDKVEISRFKGLGEMPVGDLKETTMNPGQRTLLRVELPPERQEATESRVEDLMGRNPQPRFRFIQENASTVTDLDI